MNSRREKRRSKLDQIRHQIDQLVEMLDHLDLAILTDTKYFEYHPQKINPVTLCSTTIQEIREGIQTGHELTFAHDDSFTQHIIDPVLLRHLLIKPHHQCNYVLTRQQQGASGTVEAGIQSCS